MSLFRIYRLFNWFYYLGFILIGFSIKSPLNIDIMKLLFFGAFLLSYAYSFNDYYDKHEKKKFFILPLIFSFLFLSLFNIFQIIISLIFLIIVTFYSLHPFRWKAKPFISSLCNGIGFTLLFWLGYSTFDFIGLLFSLLLFSLEMVAQFIHEIVHMKEDIEDKIKTTAIFIGIKKIKSVCLLFLFISILLSLWLYTLEIVNIIFILATTIFSIYFILRILIDKTGEKIRKEYRYFGIIIGIIYLLSLYIL